ncbi:MAG: rod shape-determining protein MreC [Candidatus Eisenbacteria bacterium]|uniref:Cell shape-determining protein MreC n=1 Tax=Eiseniibacteriota bacterium TaxID=2212470 RepID=A0A937XDE8_UNCEI|nr:rod shape-determining protein MreC [Candidatus Eisenbacteria bacterium]
MARRGFVRPGLSDWLFLALTLVLSLALLAAGPEARAGAALFLGRTLFLPFRPALAIQPGAPEARREILALRERLARESLEWSTFEETLRENDRLRRLLDFREQETSPLVPAQVVGRSLDRFGESWLIAPGGGAPARPGQAVVSVDGLVGCVYAADGGFGNVRTLRNGALQVSAMLSGTRHAGMLHWQPLAGGLVLTGIPMHVPVRRGDEVMTSGYGGIFPKGIAVGEVVSTGDDSTSLVKRVVVRPRTDFAETEEVFLLGN